MTNGEIIAAIEAFAPLGLQESWDNSGMQVGTKATECTGVLICVDVTPETVDEAIALGCNLIVSHHPLIFKGLKSLTGRTPAEAAVMNAIAAGVSVYSSHTALDNTRGGVSWRMAERLGVTVERALCPLPPRDEILSVMVPREAAESVRLAMFDAGAGADGNYDCCSFNVGGEGTFRPLPGSHPYSGRVGETYRADEVRVSVRMPSWLRGRVIDTMKQVHPYECPAYEVFAPVNPDPSVGTGVVGFLEKRLTAGDLLSRVKKAFNVPTVRCSDPTLVLGHDTPITRVALCGGAGGSMTDAAVAAGAQVYITGDIRYHDFADRRRDIFLMDIGHYESEECTKDIFYQIITEKFANFAVYKSAKGVNPVLYR